MSLATRLRVLRRDGFLAARVGTGLRSGGLSSSAKHLSMFLRTCLGSLGGTGLVAARVGADPCFRLGFWLREIPLGHFLDTFRTILVGSRRISSRGLKILTAVGVLAFRLMGSRAVLGLTAPWSEHLITSRPLTMLVWEGDRLTGSPIRSCVDLHIIRGCVIVGIANHVE